jgi:hypothetical protein
MKRMLIVLFSLLFASFCACQQTKLTEETTTTEEFATSVHTVYANFLKAYRDKDFPNPYALESLKYAFYDIDGDGANELLIGWDENIESVYSIQNGVAVEQNDYPLWTEYNPPTILFENGVIRVDNTREGQGPFSIYYYRFEDGTLRFQTGLFDYDGKEYSQYDTADLAEDTPITKAEFERLQKQYEGDGQIVQLDWKPLAEYKGK